MGAGEHGLRQAPVLRCLLLSLEGPPSSVSKIAVTLPAAPEKSLAAQAQVNTICQLPV